MIEPPTFESRLLTPERFRWVLDVSESTELAWRAEKAVAFFRRGRVVRYAPEAVLEFILKHTVKARGQRTEGGGPRSDFCLPASDWPRIERLIADQVNAQWNAERGPRTAEMEKAA